MVPTVSHAMPFLQALRSTFSRHRNGKRRAPDLSVILCRELLKRNTNDIPPYIAEYSLLFSLM